MPLSSVSSGGAGAVTVISDSTLSGAAASFDIQNIPATYAHLHLVLYLRSDRAAATTDTVALRVNNDSGNNYPAQIVQGNGAAATAAETLLTQSSLSIGACPGATATASYWAQLEVLLANYAGTTGFKSVSVVAANDSGPNTGNLTARVTGSNYISASAISRLTILSFNGANFIAGSRCTLYALASS